MSATLLQTEAVVLHALPFKEYDRILTLFTPQGLLKLFVKGKKRDYLHHVALTSPLTRAEFHYSQGRKDLHRFCGGSIVNQHLRIRDTYEALTAAHVIMNAIQCSQLPDKPAPQLYNLIGLFLEHLPKVDDPATLATAFLLKILKHEGLLHLRTPIHSTYRYAGECHLENTAPRGALFLTEQEETMLIELTLSRSLTHISELEMSSDFHQKINVLFHQAYTA